MDGQSGVQTAWAAPSLAGRFRLSTSMFAIRTVLESLRVIIRFRDSHMELQICEARCVPHVSCELPMKTPGGQRRAGAMQHCTRAHATLVRAAWTAGRREAVRPQPCDAAHLVRVLEMLSVCG